MEIDVLHHVKLRLVGTSENRQRWRGKTTIMQVVIFISYETSSPLTNPQDIHTLSHLLCEDLSREKGCSMITSFDSGIMTHCFKPRNIK